MKTDNYAEDFSRAVEEWRTKNGLEEKDAVVLLLDLFRIHQEHWDAIRHQEMPAFAEYRESILKLGESAKEYRTLSDGLLQELRAFNSHKQAIWMICLPVGSMVILAVVFGILIGRFWL